jgi:GNAT superfamily N-acetyltransferase
MFRDIHSLDDATCAVMYAASLEYFARAIPTGEYLGWLAHPDESPATIVAGVGIQLRPALPTVRRNTEQVQVATGQQGLIVNVFTEHDWRRRGLAALLMSHLLNAAKVYNVVSLMLHASSEGRPLYEKLGFVPTNEMRYTGPTSTENE